MDRPIKADAVRSDREYVIPQWIADSINNKVLLPVKKYMPGQPAPHHLSPFVDNVKEGYIPSRQKEINQLRGIEEKPVDFSSMDMKGQDDEEDDDNKPIELNDTDEEDESDSEEDSKERKPSKKQKVIKKKPKKADEVESNKDLGKLFMTKKARRLYNRH